MKALISPEEIVYVSSEIQGIRIAQIENDGNIFEIAPPFFWESCPDECDPNTWYYKDGEFFQIPKNSES